MLKKMKNVELRAKFQKNISVYFDASIGGVTSMKPLNILPTPAKDRFNLIVIKTIKTSPKPLSKYTNYPSTIVEIFLIKR